MDKLEEDGIKTVFQSSLLWLVMFDTNNAWETIRQLV